MCFGSGFPTELSQIREGRVKAVVSRFHAALSRLPEEVAQALREIPCEPEAPAVVSDQNASRLVGSRPTVTLEASRS
jgi:hypothetical protein